MKTVHIHQPQTVASGGATLLWSDEFDASLSLSTGGAGTPAAHLGTWMPNAVWQNHDRGYCDFAGTGYNLSPSSPNTLGANPFSVANSILTITSQRIPANLVAPIRAEMDAGGQGGVASPSWMGGILISNPYLRQFKYGYFEFLARYPIQGKGMFPALWFYYGGLDGVKTSAEADLLESFGVPNQWNFSIHGNTSRTVFTRNEDMAGWHTYGVNWQPAVGPTPAAFEVYRDHVLITALPPADAAWFDVNMGILMNYTMDANWFPAGNKSDGTTPNPVIVEIDYIRQWDVKPF